MLFPKYHRKSGARKSSGYLLGTVLVKFGVLWNSGKGWRTIQKSNTHTHTPLAWASNTSSYRYQLPMLHPLFHSTRIQSSH